MSSLKVTIKKARHRKNNQEQEVQGGVICWSYRGVVQLLDRELMNQCSDKTLFSMMSYSETSLYIQRL